MGGGMGMRGGMGHGMGRGMGAMGPMMGSSLKKGQVKSEVKAEPTEKHPVSLLMEKNRETPPTFDCSVDELTNKIYTVKCTVEGKVFSGEARSKKEAKKLAAAAACKAL